MKVKIEFCCDNAAFEDGFASELRKILTQARDKILVQRKRKRVICTAPEADDVLMDTNGNTVGTVEVTR